jgi:hypothetical protein
MSAENNNQITQWLRAYPAVRGVIVRGIRFADESFVSDGDVKDFPAPALEQAWRLVADTFQVLKAQRLPPTRLTWVHERTVLHCVKRADGAILGVFIARKSTDTDPMAVEKLLKEFQALPAA